MNVTDREKAIRDIFENELIPILRAKGHDYAGDGDTFGNLRDFGWKGIVVRLGDKYHRLKNFCLSSCHSAPDAESSLLKVKDENIEDTLKDLINYGFLTLVLKRNQNGTDG